MKKQYKSKSLFFRGILEIRIIQTRILGKDLWKGCESRLEVFDRTNKILLQRGQGKTRTIYTRRDDTGGNNQGSGEMPDWWHRRKGKWPETRGELLFKIEHEIHKTKTQDRTPLIMVWQKWQFKQTTKDNRKCEECADGEITGWVLDLKYYK